LKFTFGWFLAAFAVVWVFGAIVGISKEYRRGTRLNWIVWVAGFLIVLGALGFFGSALAATGTVRPAASFEWPAGYVQGVVVTSTGYAVPLEPSGRIQIYDSSWRFLRGWQIDAGGGNFKILVTNPGSVEVFTARGRNHYTYTDAGELLGSVQYPEDYYAIPNGRSVMVPTSPLLWVFSSPFSCWGLVVIGALGLKLSKRTRNLKK
jgi:hypothetical protein